MENVFREILNMSLTASVVILVVLLVRLGLRKAPKIYSYALWAVVLFRLLCPVSLPSPVSVLEVAKPEVVQTEGVTTSISYIPAQTFRVEPQVQTGVPSTETQVTEHRHGPEAASAAAVLWAVGVVVMLLRSFAEFLQLRRRLVGAMRLRENIYLADHIATPFTMGFAMAKIYLPSGIPSRERHYIVAHEQHHIRRGDHIIKLLAYFALSLHWFNPLAWIAFVQAGKDMEMSCDEAVIRKLGSGIRADYSASLLRLATRQRIISGTPLAFGEGDTKGRIKNMAKWKKPKLWVSLICLLVCATILVACAVNPQTASSAEGTITGKVSTSKGLNIRKEPLAMSEVVGNYEDGTMITILEINDNWGRTDLGWVSLNYVTTMDGTSMVDIGQIDPSVEDSTPTDIENEMKPLNIREKPDKSSAVVGSYPNGTIVTILETKEDWGRTDQGWIHMDYVTTVDGNTVVDTSDFQPAVNGSGIITDIELVQYGVMTMALPDGYTCREENGSVILMLNGADVGGITCWPTPQEALMLPGHSGGGNMEQWVRALGLPEAQESEEPIAYMIEGSLYGDLQAEFFNELAPEKLNVRHHFFIDGAVVYDIYYNQNLLSGAQAEAFLKTVTVSGDPVVIPDPTEADFLAKCKAVLDMVQKDGCGIYAVRENKGTVALNQFSMSTFYQQKDNWLISCEIPESGGSGFLWYMEVDGVHYNTERNGWDENGPIWAKQNPVEVGKPWLAVFQWEADKVTYMDTFVNGGEETVMLRINEPYLYGENNVECYFVNFVFADGGTFLRADLSVNLFMDNAFDVTETVLTLDPQEVRGQIEKECTRAVNSAS